LYPSKEADFNFLTGADMIPLISQPGKPRYEQIYEFYRDAILSNRLKYEYKLPPHRTLAKELGVGNNTVLKAYEQLVLEGYVKNENRKGLYVAKLDAQDWQLKPSGKRSNPQIAKAVSETVHADFVLTDNIVDERSFPIKQWRRCNNWALDGISFRYAENELTDPLKAPLIKYLFHSRGVVTTPDRLIIGSGASALFFWLAFILRKTHPKMLFEEPGYARARTLFSEFGYEIKPVPVENDGLNLKKLTKEKSDLLFLTPSHQYPTGATIPVGHRIQILNWAERNKAYIIEDDFDCEFRYKTRLVPSLQGLDRFDRVIYVGSFSNSMMPSLRVGYLVLPRNFKVPYEAFKHLNAVPYVTRKTLAYFMEEGYWERHLKRMRKIYQEKYNASIEALNKLPKGHIHFNDSSSGQNILLRINTKLSEQTLIKRALNKGIIITPASTFYYNPENRPRQPEVLFEFGNLLANEIEKVVKNLYNAWFR
jgi:GntR family transcriptional regulator / MocR family aminotransferase